MKKDLDYLRRGDSFLAKRLAKISPKTGEDYRNSSLKRVVDATLATAMAIPAIPVIAGLAGAHIITERDRPFLRQERVGISPERPAIIYKIRTMKPWAMLPQHYGSKGLNPDGTDPRITRLGRFMRPRELEELPQLYDVVRGKQALVEIRAISSNNREAISMLRPEEFLIWERNRTASRRTGVFHLHGVYDPDRKTAPDRNVRWDNFYAEHASLGLDLYILYKGIRNCLRGESVTVK